MTSSEPCGQAAKEVLHPAHFGSLIFLSVKFFGRSLIDMKMSSVARHGKPDCNMGTLHVRDTSSERRGCPRQLLQSPGKVWLWTHRLFCPWFFSSMTHTWGLHCRKRGKKLEKKCQKHLARPPPPPPPPHPKCVNETVLFLPRQEMLLF